MYHRTRRLGKIVEERQLWAVCACRSGHALVLNGLWHGNRSSLIDLLPCCHVVQGREVGEVGTPGPVPAIPPYTHSYHQLLVSEWHACEVHVVPLKLI